MNQPLDLSLLPPNSGWSPGDISTSLSFTASSYMGDSLPRNPALQELPWRPREQEQRAPEAGLLFHSLSLTVNIQHEVTVMPEEWEPWEDPQRPPFTSSVWVEEGCWLRTDEDDSDEDDE